MKVMVIGGGGREMALVNHLVQYHEVVSAGGSDAIAAKATVIPLPSPQSPQVNNGDEAAQTLVELWNDAWESLAAYAAEHNVDMTIVGPEAPLASGICDVFHKNGLNIFGPTAAAARIETSKSFAKDVMSEADVPTARYELFDDAHTARAYIEAPDTRYPIVLKENGLRAGKGVTICHDATEALDTLRSLTIDADDPLIIEEFLEGFEFSLIVMAHGTSYAALPVAQDHKPIGEGNIGLNTGGMGAVSPVPKVSNDLYQEALATIVEPTLAELKRRGTPFTGFLYAGLIATTTGPKVIEFNARLGDPEAEVILPRITTDIAEIALNLLSEKPAKVTVSPQTCVGVVLSSPGYPQTITAYPVIPTPLIDAVDSAPHMDLIHMGTTYRDGMWHASGGRVALISACGETIEECQTLIYNVLHESIRRESTESLYYRKDIGNFAS